MAVVVKTVSGLAYASVKTINGLAVASVKTVQGMDATSGGSLLIDENFEGTGTPTGWTVGAGTPDFDNTSSPLSGSQDLLLNADGDDVRTPAWSESAETWITFEWLHASQSGDAFFLFLYKDADLSGQYVGIKMKGAKLQLFHSGNTEVGTPSVDSLPAATHLYFRFHVLAGSGANAAYDAEFSTSNSFTGSGDKFTSYSSGTLTGGLRIAQLYRDPNFGNCQFDNFKVSNSGWPS